MRKNNKDLEITFWSEVPGLSGIEELRPQKMSKFLPDWWKNVPYRKNSVKTCPSFADVFSSLYVIPMWCDTEFYMKNGEVFWKTPSRLFSYDFHSQDQLQDFLPDTQKEKISAIVKAISPWRIKTSEGYSVYEMPLFWHFNEKFTIAPGIQNTDYMHEANQQIILYLQEGESFVIERGEPFVAYLPFKREQFKLTVREKTEQDSFYAGRSRLLRETKFMGGYKNFFRNIKD